MNSAKLLILAATVAVLNTASIAQAADVGVSVSVGEPGFYGQIDIGDFPRPILVRPQPIIIQRPVGVVYEPIYLHVPPGHAKRWGQYCGRYGACSRPVYFVQDRWYNDVYVPQYRDSHPRDRDFDHDNDHGDDDHGHGRGHDMDHEWNQGHGNGHHH